jgi:hypothetical protein
LAARERIWAQHRRRRISGELEALAPLARYYRTWNWPDGRYRTLVEGEAVPA